MMKKCCMVLVLIVALMLGLMATASASSTKTVTVNGYTVTLSYWCAGHHSGEPTIESAVVQYEYASGNLIEMNFEVALSCATCGTSGTKTAVDSIRSSNICTEPFKGSTLLSGTPTVNDRIWVEISGPAGSHGAYDKQWVDKNIHSCMCGYCYTIVNEPHTFNVDSLTCTAAKICTDCYYVVAPALGHDWHANNDGAHSCQNDGCDQQNVACTADTVATCCDEAECQVCHYKWKDPDNHAGDTEVRDAKEPTLTEEGYTGDTWCLGCESVIEYGESIPLLPMEYYKMNVCSIGPRFRDVGGPAGEWFMFTPVDLSADGEQSFDLIAGDMHRVGTVTLTIADGKVTVACNYASNALWTREAYFTFLPSLEAATAEALAATGGFPYGQPISIADDLGGDTQVLLFIRNAVSYPVIADWARPFQNDDAYRQLVEDMKLLME